MPKHSVGWPVCGRCTSACDNAQHPLVIDIGQREMSTVALGLIGNAVKELRRRFIVNVLAATTIALGVGASTAVFSVANAVLLRPLPYKDPNRIVIASIDLRKNDVRDVPFSGANLADLRDQTKSTFEDFAGVETQRAIVLTENGTPEQISVASVTTNFFRLLGANIAYGRDFSDQDGLPQPPRSPSTTPQMAPAPLPYIGIISYEYFVRRYGRNPAILGHPMLPPGQPVRLETSSRITFKWSFASSPACHLLLHRSIYAGIGFCACQLPFAYCAKSVQGSHFLSKSPV